MTDVGKISLGVEIHGDDLSAKLGEAVRKAIAPALAEIQRELEKVQREYEKTGRAAEESAVKQIEGAQAVEHAMKDTSNEAEKSATKVAVSSGVSARAIRDVTLAIREQTEAWNANTAARAANAAAPTGGPPSNRGGGGGSDYYGGGGGRRSGVLGFLTGPVGLNSIALGAQALPALTTGIVNVVGAVQQLAQAGGVLPGIFAGGASVIGTAAIGLVGIKDAVKELNKAADDPKKLAEANKQLEKMAPAAADVARELSKLSSDKDGSLRNFQKGIAQPMLDGVAADIDNFSKNVLPRVEPGMQAVAKSLNGTIRTAFREVGSDKTLNFAEQIFGNTAEAENRANKAIKPFLSAFGQLAVTGTQLLPRLADGLTGVTQRFDNFITKNAASGNLFTWIDKGITSVTQLGNGILNLGKFITGLTSAAGNGDSFLNGLVTMTDKWQAFANSAEGQNKLGNFFAQGRDDLHQWADLFREIWPVLKNVISGFAQWGQVTLPIISALAGLVGWLNKIPGLVQAMVVAFLAVRTIGPLVGGVMNKVGGFGQTLESTAEHLMALEGAEGARTYDQQGVVGGGRGGRGGKGRGRGAIPMGRGGGFSKGQLAVAGLGFAALGSTIGQATGQDNVGGQVLSAIGDIGGTALTGATIGSVIPGVGTGIGALAGAGVGAVLAGINYLTADNAKATNDAAAAQDKWAAAIAQSNAAHDAQQAAIKGASDALTASGGVIDQTTLNSVAEQVNQVPKLLSGFHSDDVVAQVAKDMASLGQTADQTAKIITGSQSDFDALTARLTAMGPAGELAAKQLAEIRDDTLGAATNATTAAPLLQALTKDGGDVTDTLVRVQNAFAAIPTDVPVNIHQRGGDAVEGILKDLGAQVTELPDGTIHLDAPLAPQVQQQLEAIGVQLKQNENGTINIELAGWGQTMDQLAQLDAAYSSLIQKGGSATLPAPQVAAPPSLYQGDTGGMTIGGRAQGGPIWGGIPGVDSVPILAQHGEFVLDTGDVARMGGVSGVERFRNRLAAGMPGFADGGPVGVPAPGMATDDGTELGVLRQIRDLLAGRGGAASNPLAATAANTARTATATKGLASGAAGTEIGPFGTPLKSKGNVAYNASKAALQALGFDPETIIGTDPGVAGAGLPGLPGAVGGVGGANRGALAAALSKFAKSGNLADLAGLGLDASTPVVSAITTARNKQKNGLSDDTISGLVSQILGGTPFAGTLDSQNTPLVRSLQRYSDQLNKTGGVAAGVPGVGIPGVGVPGSAAALDAFAQSANGGKYAAASDLTHGLADCSGAVSDLVEFLTKGQAGPERLFTTANEAQVLQSLGAQQGFVPGNLNIGFSATHTAATLPNGVNFESGGSGGGVVYGGPVGALDKQFTQVYNLPTDAAGQIAAGGFGGAGLAGFGAGAGRGAGHPLGYSGQPVPVYIVGGPGGFGGGIPGGPNGLPGQLLGAGITAAGQAASTVVGDVVGAAGSVPTPGIGHANGNASLLGLVGERNPLALASAAGYNVPDYTRRGGENSDKLLEDQKYTATGEVKSDTSALVERTVTDLNAQLKAQFDQLLSVMDQVRQQLNDKALTPILQNAIQEGVGQIKDSVLNGLGTSIGNAAAPPIADAVKDAVQSVASSIAAAGKSSGGANDGVAAAVGNTTSDIGGAVLGGLFAEGGAVSGGIPGKDSVPILAQAGEWVLNTKDVAKLGGTQGVARFVGGLRSGSIRGYASGGNVNPGTAGSDPNAAVGADFFGVSQIPIIGTIVNLLIQVLLKVLGVEIKVRDTMNDLSGEVRQFRGDAFKTFDAQGRLFSDTSALLDRSSTSNQEAADERVRILKIVIQALIKYIIEKIIVPITKAVANVAIQAGASAAGAAIGASGGGPAGGIVSSIIGSAGQAGVEIVGDIAGEFASAAGQVITQAVFEGLQSTFPDLITSIFSGGALQALFAPFLVMASAATISGPGGSFDNGGVATGMGFLPKARLEPERVLNPGQTALFERFVAALENGKRMQQGDAPKMIEVGGIHMHGTNATPDAVASRLTSLLS